MKRADYGLDWWGHLRPRSWKAVGRGRWPCSPASRREGSIAQADRGKRGWAGGSTGLSQEVTLGESGGAARSELWNGPVGKSPSLGAGLGSSPTSPLELPCDLGQLQSLVQRTQEMFSMAASHPFLQEVPRVV